MKKDVLNNIYEITKENKSRLKKEILKLHNRCNMVYRYHMKYKKNKRVAKYLKRKYLAIVKQISNLQIGCNTFEYINYKIDLYYNRVKYE